MSKDRIEGTEVEYVDKSCNVTFKNCRIIKFDPEQGATVMGEVVSGWKGHEGELTKVFCLIRNGRESYSEKLKWFLDTIEKGTIDGHEFENIFYPHKGYLTLSSEPPCAFE